LRIERTSTKRSILLLFSLILTTYTLSVLLQSSGCTYVIDQVPHYSQKQSLHPTGQAPVDLHSAVREKEDPPRKAPTPGDLHRRWSYAATPNPDRDRGRTEDPERGSVPTAGECEVHGARTRLRRRNNRLHRNSSHLLRTNSAKETCSNKRGDLRRTWGTSHRTGGGYIDRGERRYRTEVRCISNRRLQRTRGDYSEKGKQHLRRTTHRINCITEGPANNNKRGDLRRNLRNSHRTGGGHIDRGELRYCTEVRCIDNGRLHRTRGDYIEKGKQHLRRTTHRINCITEGPANNNKRGDLRRNWRNNHRTGGGYIDRGELRYSTEVRCIDNGRLHRTRGDYIEKGKQHLRRTTHRINCIYEGPTNNNKRGNLRRNWRNSHRTGGGYIDQGELRYCTGVRCIDNGRLHRTNRRDHMREGQHLRRNKKKSKPRDLHTL
jgi:uncharacterized protein YnzC (UPF0291/DUF896 family)